MAWPRDESRPRITPDGRRAGLLTLVLGGLLIAGLLVMLIPTEQRFAGKGELACGTPLSAAFKSAGDYVDEFASQQALPVHPGPRRYVDVVPPRGLRTAGAACVSVGRTRTSIGGALVLLALAGCVAAFVAGRRSLDRQTG